jgi:hypothetical protein
MEIIEFELCCLELKLLSQKFMHLLGGSRSEKVSQKIRNNCTPDAICMIFPAHFMLEHLMGWLHAALTGRKQNFDLWFYLPPPPASSPLFPPQPPKTTPQPTSSNFGF